MATTLRERQTPPFHMTVTAVATVVYMSVLLSGTDAAAQAWRIEPGVAVAVDATSNSDYGNNRNGDADVVVRVSPFVAFTANGARLKARGQFQLDSYSYLQNTQTNQVLPQGAADASLTLVEQWAGVDASLSTRQTTANPFGTQSTSLGGLNTYTTTQTRVSPFIAHDLTPSLALAARVDAVLTSYGETDNAVVSRPDARSLRNTASLAMKPRPLGGALELAYQKAQYVDRPTSELTQQSGRALVSYALLDQMVVSAIGGQESTQTSFRDRDDPIYGGRIEWRPSERVQLEATLEHHFFGPAWQASLAYRRPTFSGSINLSRQLESSANSLGSIPEGGTLSGLLNSMLTTRYPDATERASVVNDIVNSKGLSSTGVDAQDYYSLSVTLQQSATVRMAWMGKRDTLAFTFGSYRSTPQGWASDPLSAALDVPNQQNALGIEFNHQLTTQTTFDTVLRWSRTRTPGTSKEATEESIRMSLQTKLAPRTLGTLGVRFQTLDSSILTERINQTTLLVGLTHRF